MQSHQSSGNQVSLGAAAAGQQPYMSTEQMKYLPQPTGVTDPSDAQEHSQAFAARDLIPRTPYINR